MKNFKIERPKCWRTRKMGLIPGVHSWCHLINMNNIRWTVRYPLNGLIYPLNGFEELLSTPRVICVVEKKIERKIMRNDSSNNAMLWISKLETPIIARDELTRSDRAGTPARYADSSLSPLSALLSKPVFSKVSHQLPSGMAPFNG